MSKKLSRHCPVCGFETGKSLHSQKFILPDKHPLRNGYDVVLCEQCNFLFADSPVTQEDYDIYYSDFSKYEDNHTSTGGGEAGFDAKRMEEVALKISTIAGDKNSRILDLGCANGGIIRRLKQLGYTSLVGVDPSQACVDHINNELRIEAHKASLFDMSESIGKFDLIILSHVMEHILDLKGCLEMVSKFLNKDGMMYIEVPDGMRYVDFITSPFQDFNTEHINHFSRYSLDNLFLHSGFDKINGRAKIIESAPAVPYPAIFAFYRKNEKTESIPYEQDNEIEKSISEYIRKSQNVIDKIDILLDESFAKDEPLLIWGTGQLTMKLLAISKLGKLSIVNFIDSNPILKGKSILDKKILHPTQLGEIPHNLKILITSTIHEDEIKKDMSERYKLLNPIVSLRSCLN